MILLFDTVGKALIPIYLRIFQNILLQNRADKCSVCGEIIVGAYYNIGDKIYCEEDYKANCETCPR